MQQHSLTIIALLALGCSAQPAANEVELTLEALFVGAPAMASMHPTERVAALPAELSRSSADVICLTGLWDADNRELVRESVSREFPYSLELPTATTDRASDPRNASGVIPDAPTTPPCGPASASALDAALACVSRCDGGDHGRLIAPACLDDAECGGNVAQLTELADPDGRCRACFLSQMA